MRATLWVAAGAGTLLGCIACSGHDVSFEHLRTANRIQVTSITNDPIATISTEGAVRSVLGFLESHREGWSERLSRGSVPRLVLNFFQDGRLLGSVGIGPDYITDAPQRSFASTSVDAAEVAQLLVTLGVSWPSDKLESKQ